VEPFLEKFENNLYISSFKEAIISVGFPLMLAGSVFYIAVNPPRGTDSEFFKVWMSSAFEFRNELMIPYYFTCGMVSLVMAFTLSYKVSQKLKLNPLLSGIISVLSYLGLCFPGDTTGFFTIMDMSKITGPNGLFMALLVSIACVKILAFLERQKLCFNAPFGLSASLSIAFKNMFPIMAVIPLMWVLGWILRIILGHSLQLGLSSLAISIISSTSGLAKDMLSSAMTSLLYFIGMDGQAIKQPVYTVLMNQGGVGTLLPLIILFMLSYSRHLKHIGQLVIIPGLFNIPYPVIFAVPLILNPIYLIPFILCPLINTLLNYLIVASGMLTITVEATQTMPVILSGYFSTAGQVLGVVLQLFNFVLSAFIYYPFFRYHECRMMQLYEREKRRTLSK